MENKEKIIKSFDLIYETWQVYAKNFVKFIQLIAYGLIGIIPMFVLIALFYAYGVSGLAQKASVLTNIIFGAIAFFSFFASLYFAILYSIRSSVASLLLIKNNFTSAKENFKEAKPYFVKFLGVSLLTVVLVLAWGILFIIPAIIFGVYYCFASYILVLEDARPFTSIERSYDLVRGYFWPVFGRLLLVYLIGFIVYRIISLPMDWMDDTSAAGISYSVFFNLIWVAISPYFMVYAYNLYKSLKKINK